MNASTKRILCKVALVSCGYGIFSDSVVVPLLTSIYADFPDASQFLCNFIVTGGYFFSLIASLATGYLLRRVSKRKMLIAGTVCFMIGGVGGYFARSMEFLAFTRAVDGLSDGILAVTVLAMIGELYDSEKERATMMGLYSGVSALFGVLLSFFSGIICAKTNWHNAFLMNGIFLISVILVIIAVPETAVDPSKKKASLLSAFRNRTVNRLYLEFFVSSALYCILFVFVDIYVAEKQLGDSVLSGTISSVGSTVTFLTGVAFAPLYTRLRRFDSLIGFAGLGAMFLLLYLTGNAGVSVILFALAAFFYSYLYSYYNTEMSIVSPADTLDMNMGVLNSSYNIACFVSSYIPYALMPVFRMALVSETFQPIAGILLLFAVIILFRMLHGKKEEQAK